MAVNSNGSAFIFAVDSDTTISQWTTSAASLYAAGYAMDGTYFAIAGSSNKIFMYNATNHVNTLEEELVTDSQSDFISARFSYDSNYFAAGNEDGTVYLFSRFCQGCPVGSYKNQTYCRACYLDLTGCAICTNSSVCVACNSGYYISS